MTSESLAHGFTAFLYTASAASLSYGHAKNAVTLYAFLFEPIILNSSAGQPLGAFRHIQLSSFTIADTHQLPAAKTVWLCKTQQRRLPQPMWRQVACARFRRHTG